MLRGVHLFHPEPRLLGEQPEESKGVTIDRSTEQDLSLHGLNPASHIVKPSPDSPVKQVVKSPVLQPIDPGIPAWPAPGYDEIGALQHPVDEAGKVLGFDSPVGRQGDNDGTKGIGRDGVI
jgi:hypothetical protein